MISFKEKMQKGKPLIGTILSLGQPAVAEAVSRLGYEWLWIDMEHAPLSLEDTQLLLTAKSPECAGFVRIPVNDETWIKQVLDLGADGIIVPQVMTAEEAQKAVAASKYPPQGRRSVGLARATVYGMEFADYVQTANDKLMVILQIEHEQGVKNIDAILQVPGVDAVIIGPYDLSGSYGKLGQINDAVVQQAIETIHAACRKHGMPIGIFCLQTELANTYIRKGYQLIALGVDIHFLWTGARAGLEALTQGSLTAAKP